MFVKRAGFHMSFAIRSSIALSALALLLVSCGGDGSGGEPVPPSPPPATGNRDPGLTSPQMIEVEENISGTFYTATATDPDGDQLIFSIAGGNDSTQFSMTPAGALSFQQSPDFERPRDFDQNNVYFLQIGVSDGRANIIYNLYVTVRDAGPSAFRVRRLTTGILSPVAVFPQLGAVGNRQMYVVERGGRIYLFGPETTGAQPGAVLLNISSEVSTDGERGLLGATLATFDNLNALYILVTNRAGDIEVRRYRLAVMSNRLLIPDPSVWTLVLRIPHPLPNHNGGWIEVGPDGFIYLGLGDGGGSGDPQNNAQNPNSLFGKILRINPQGDAYPSDPLRNYSIPSDNPFASGGGAPEVWALGLRNPYRASRDSLTQDIWIGDVGENSREEINLLRPTDGGANFGWNILEGTAPFAGTTRPGLIAPVAEYFHGSGPREGRSVVGGVVYRGPIETFRGEYFFGDFVTGNIFSIPVSSVSLGQTIPSSDFTLRTTQFQPDQGSIDQITAFGTDKEGNLYIVDFDGEIFIVESL